MSGTRIMVIGNGIAGAALVDSLVEEAPNDFPITLYGDERVGTYDRVRLSEYMAGSVGLEELGMRPKAWYEERGIDVRLGVRVEEINTAAKKVRGDDGEWAPYDKLVLATGSSSWIPPLIGREKDGVFVFRTVRDTEEMLEAEPGKAVVIGGGLLGLEAAYGLTNRGAAVTVVHLAGHLMNQQLDGPAGAMLGRAMAGLGIGVRLNAHTEEILGNGKVQGVRLRGGEELDADLVVICTGIRPNAGLARRAGLKVNTGIVVDDHLATSAEDVYAVGECAEHGGKTIGLVAPALEQVRVLSRRLRGDGRARYVPGGTATRLKVMGVDLESAGDVYGEEKGSEAILSSNPVKGVYRKAVVREGKVVGVVLLGDTTGGPQLLGAVRQRAEAEEYADLILGSGGEVKAPPLPDDAQVCDCNGVSKGQILVAITDKGAESVSEIGAATRAGASCGSCKPIIKTILEEASGGPVEEKEELCKCMGLSTDDVRGIVKERGIKSVSALGEACGAGKVCSDCKVGLTYVVSEVNANRHEEERHARHINDRVHGNIQNDGTFSIVPRTRGGVTTADELRRIADVAEKYEARMIKITGSQRLDILGVKKEDLPGAWEDLGMPSGFAYGKAFRQVKTCVGTEFCRFGVGDSTSLGIELEETFENLYTPAKVKMAASGCPRNCAESTVKDVGVIAIEGGWQVWIGGAAGMDVRKGDLLATVETHEEAVQVVKAFFQYYRENGRWKERTYDFVPRVGLEEIKKHVLAEGSGEPERLRERLAEAKAASFDPWQERVKNKTKNQFAGVVNDG
jgi:nitrite reductase (NADH) large subunit